MVNAVENGSTDGVGLARTITEEPNLPTLLISGAAKGARPTLLDQNDFMITNIASGTQIRQIGYGKAPWDSTKKENVEKFFAVVQEFIKQMQEDGQEGIIRAGFPVVDF